MIGGIGDGPFGAFGGIAGAALSSKLAGETQELSDNIANATGSSLLGNISGNILSGLVGGVVGGSAGAAMASNVNLYNQGNDTGEKSATQKAREIAERIKDALVQTLTHPISSVEYAFGIKFSLPRGQGSGTDADVLTGGSSSTSPLSQSRTDLILQGIRNGLGGISFFEGGGPFTPSGATVLVNSGVPVPGVAVPGSPGYLPPTATVSNGDGGTQGASGSGAGSSEPDASGAAKGPKVPPNLQPFTNPAQSPVIPPDWVSQPGKTPGSVIYYPPGTDPSAPGSTYIRVMPAGSTSVPGLEGGYWIWMKNGQPRNPATGGTGTRGQTHIPLPPNGMPPMR